MSMSRDLLSRASSGCPHPGVPEEGRPAAPLGSFASADDRLASLRRSSRSARARSHGWGAAAHPAGLLVLRSASVVTGVGR